MYRQSEFVTNVTNSDLNIISTCLTVLVLVFIVVNEPTDYKMVVAV